MGKRLLGSFIHLLGAYHREYLYATFYSMRSSGTKNKGHFSSHKCGCIGKCYPHFSRREIAYKSHRVYHLIGRASSDEYLFALEEVFLGKEESSQLGYYALRLRHTSLTYQTTG